MKSALGTLFVTLALGMMLGCFSPAPPLDNNTDNQNTGDNNTTDNNTVDDNNNTDDSFAISGTIAPGQSGKRAPRAQESTEDYPFTIVAQSNETGEIYRADTDADGSFKVDLPDSEQGNTFTVTIVDPNSHVVGPLVFDEPADGSVTTGITPTGNASVGTVDLPYDPTQTPIEPGADADVGDMIDGTVTARADENGVPVGLSNNGKGDDAVNGTSTTNDLADPDRDGLIDIFDADDNGNGLVDDFDTSDPGGIPQYLHVNFFTNLKIEVTNATTYYNGTDTARRARLAEDTVITLEMMLIDETHSPITAVRVLETPGPAYLATADMSSGHGPGSEYSNWKAKSYAFSLSESGDRWEAFVQPHSVMAAGDTFTFEVTYENGTTGVYARMINYIFENIPRLDRQGPTGSTSAFDIESTTQNGTPDHPILFDGDQDLVLEFYPPLDENGDYLTDLPYYTFQFFYQHLADNMQIDNIDFNATWPSPPEGWQNNTVFLVGREDLVDTGHDTYRVTLPKEIFADFVETDEGSITVGQYKIDITAECSSGNAALMLTFAKE